MLIPALAALLFMQVAPTHHTIFVIDKVVQNAEAHNVIGGVAATSGEHHTAPIVMAEFAKRCPAVTFTQDQSVADFLLQTQSGGTILSDQKGTVLYVSPAKQLRNMAKDVCKFISER